MFKVILAFVALFLISCTSNKDKDDSTSNKSIYENNLLEDYELFEKANNFIETEQYELALIELDKIEVLFPSSKFANKGMLLSAYIHFLDEEYEKTRAIAESYKQYYPGSLDIVYANYLDAMTYYVLIKKPEYSQESAYNSLQKFNFILNAYPNSKYEIDIITKIQIISNNLAANKLATARFYINRKNLTGALNYLKDIFENHNTSLSIEETLYLLVKIYDLIEEPELAMDYAAILAYNFPDSEWYQKSFNLINDIEMKNNEKWFERLNPIKIIIDEQEKDDFDIKIID